MELRRRQIGAIVDAIIGIDDRPCVLAGDFELVGIRLVGTTWPSDHAGVLVLLEMR